MEKSLDEGRLQEVLDEAKTLPPTAADAATDFLSKVKARVAVDHALTALDDQLKASLGAAGTPSSGSTK
jgi:hypothetical protein